MKIKTVTLNSTKEDVAQDIYDSIKKKEDEKSRRFHFGLSQAGHECDRYLWLSFRWALDQKLDGRILRLFRRGHLEEEMLEADLLAAGFEVNHMTKDQISVDAGSHVSGSLDGFIKYKGKTHLLEIKTHNDKSFNDMVKKGVKESKPMHYIQMQVYMYLYKKVDRALYFAINKNDDKIYAERIKLDKTLAKRKVERCKSIALDNRLPPPLSEDATFFKCKICSFHSFCHKRKMPDFSNCRTCAHSTPKEDSTWYCERWKDTIPQSHQEEGCRSHVIHPDLIEYELTEPKDEWTAQYMVEGVKVPNGENGFKSSELIANAYALAFLDGNTELLISEFGAELIK